MSGKIGITRSALPDESEDDVYPAVVDTSSSAVMSKITLMIIRLCISYIK